VVWCVNDVCVRFLSPSPSVSPSPSLTLSYACALFLSCARALSLSLSLSLSLPHVRALSLFLFLMRARSLSLSLPLTRRSPPSFSLPFSSCPLLPFSLSLSCHSSGLNAPAMRRLSCARGERRRGEGRRVVRACSSLSMVCVVVCARACCALPLPQSGPLFHTRALRVSRSPSLPPSLFRAG
jgi:hypothetical protein